MPSRGLIRQKEILATAERPIILRQELDVMPSCEKYEHTTGERESRRTVWALRKQIADLFIDAGGL